MNSNWRHSNVKTGCQKYHDDHPRSRQPLGIICCKRQLYVITWKLIQAARFFNPQQPESLFQMSSGENALWIRAALCALGSPPDRPAPWAALQLAHIILSHCNENLFQQIKSSPLFVPTFISGQKPAPFLSARGAHSFLTALFVPSFPAPPSRIQISW